MLNRIPLIMLLCAPVILGSCDDHALGVPVDDGVGGLVYTPDWQGVTEMSEDHCQGCHAVGGTAAFLPLPDSLAFDLDAGTGGLVVPFEPDNSKVWRVIGGTLDTSDFGDMPLGARLPEQYVGHIKLWIEAGAPYPAIVRDDDNDGVSVADGDCDDLNPAINPSAEELCDGIDNNCDGVIDGADATGASTWYPDDDLDGYGSEGAGADRPPVVHCDTPAGYLAFGGDCDDAEASVHPGALELDCRDGTDYDCDGVPFGVDADSDQSWACDDCDDGDSTVFPGAPETCDGIDQDCDMVADNNAIDATLWYPDLDQDGHGDINAPGTAGCSAPYVGWSQSNDDCNDSNASVSPSANEICNGVDNDCDGVADDGAIDQTAWYTDADGDGYGDDASQVLSCSAPVGMVALGGDCDDADVAYNPGAAETDCLDPNDYNCDGVVGAVDNDGDGFFACQECDDQDANVNPNEADVCDGLDNDCDGIVDNGGGGSLWYPDADADGFGDDSAPGTLACSQPAPGWVTLAGDCDDTDSTSNPSGIEVCDGVDNDCNGPVDDNALDANTWYVDGDGDGDGAGVGLLDCSAVLPGYVLVGDDCDDADPTIHSGATEVCDGVDNDCSGAVDDNPVDGTRFYADSDGDGFGALSDPGFLDCRASVPGASTDNTDCNDGDASVNPGAAEVCDGIDNDCSLAADDNAIDGTDFYPDGDGDGYGDEFGAVLVACANPGGMVGDNTDCDDSDPSVNPGVLYDFINGVDDNCVDGVDEDGAAPSAAADIQPIIDNYCTGTCHAPPAPSGGQDLTDVYANTVNVPSGDAPAMFRVTPFDTVNSYLWHKLQGTQLSVGGAGLQMPLAQPGPPQPPPSAQELG